jgi:putative PIN family toxin of toxin-antitoxin system
VKVFLDTNVLVSAVATRGLCADVLREVLTSHELVISDSLLKELKRVLQQKLRLPSPLISGYIDLLQQDTIFAKPVNLPDVAIKDKDDLIILASALSANSDLLVTGDRELLALGKVRNLEIVSPREFWEKLKNAGAEGRRGRGKER